MRILLLIILGLTIQKVSGQRMMENLDRGVVAVRKAGVSIPKKIDGISMLRRYPAKNKRNTPSFTGNFTKQAVNKP
jgi:hypothetical protein